MKTALRRQILFQRNKESVSVHKDTMLRIPNGLLPQPIETTVTEELFRKKTGRTQAGTHTDFLEEINTIHLKDVGP